MTSSNTPSISTMVTVGAAAAGTIVGMSALLWAQNSEKNNEKQAKL